MELRWDGVPSLADALRMLTDQARRTPPPQWVRVVGGWYEFQFAERQMPTLEEINAAAPDTPVFVLHLYDRALLNRAALRAVGYTRDTPESVGGTIERDRRGEPTGMLVARDTEMRLQKEGLATAHSIEEWAWEAGPEYFGETVSGVTRAMKEADSVIAARSPADYGSGKRPQ
jgi:predicted amidohydrolase YtcJ